MKSPVLVLAGGVGGAKLAQGLSRLFSPLEMTIVVNTGDAEDFYGLRVCPDLDNMMYTLAGLANSGTGRGISGDTFNALDQMGAYGADTWLRLGDRDMATHVRRTELLGRGHTLSEVTRIMHTALGVNHPIVPMSNEPVRTIVNTDQGEMPFQVYFAKRHSRPGVKGVRFEGAESARPAPAFTDALDRAASIVLSPLDPFLGLAPILAVPGIRDRIEAFSGLRVAVSPIVGEAALGDTEAKVLGELGYDVSCAGVAEQYQDMCDVFVMDEADRHRAEDIEWLGMRPEVTSIVMNSDDDSVRLARYIQGLSR